MRVEDNMALNNTILFTDCRGNKWTDWSGYYEENPQPCFMCGRGTHRLDASFETFFCNSEECNDMIKMKLLEYDLGGAPRDFG